MTTLNELFQFEDDPTKPVIPRSTAIAAGQGAVKAAVTSQQKVTNRNKAATEQAQLFQNMGEVIQKELGVAAQASRDLTQLEVDVRKQTAENNQTVAATYRAYDSEETNRLYTQAVSHANEIQGKLQALRVSMAEGGGMTRFLGTFKEHALQKDLLQAQQEVRNLQSGYMNAAKMQETQFAANTSAAMELSAVERAEIKQRQSNAVLAVKLAQDTRQLSKENMDMFAAQNNLDLQETQAYFNTLTAMQKTDSLTAAQANAELQLSQLNSFKRREKEAAEAAKRTETYWQERQQLWDNFREMMKVEDVAPSNFRAMVEAKDPNPWLQRFAMFDATHNMTGQGPYSMALERSKTSQKTPGDEIAIRIAEQRTQQTAQNLRVLADAKLAAIEAPMGTAAYNEQAKQIEKEYQDAVAKNSPANPDYIVNMDRAVQEEMKQANIEAGMLMKMGVISTLPMDVVLENPIMSNNMDVPVGTKEIFKQEGFKSIDYTISANDPVGSINSILDQVADQIYDSAKDANTQQDLALVLGDGLGGYFTANLRALNQSGLPQLTGFNMRGIRLGVYTRVNKDLDRLDRRIDITNGGTLGQYLLNRINQRRVQEKTLESAVFTDPAFAVPSGQSDIKPSEPQQGTISPGFGS